MRTVVRTLHPVCVVKTWKALTPQKSSRGEFLGSVICSHLWHQQGEICVFTTKKGLFGFWHDLFSPRDLIDYFGPGGWAWSVLWVWSIGMWRCVRMSSSRFAIRQGNELWPLVRRRFSAPKPLLLFLVRICLLGAKTPSAVGPGSPNRRSARIPIGSPEATLPCWAFGRWAFLGSQESPVFDFSSGLSQPEIWKGRLKGR